MASPRCRHREPEEARGDPRCRVRSSARRLINSWSLLVRTQRAVSSNRGGPTRLVRPSLVAPVPLCPLSSSRAALNVQPSHLLCIAVQPASSPSRPRPQFIRSSSKPNQNQHRILSFICTRILSWAKWHWLFVPHPLERVSESIACCLSSCQLMSRYQHFLTAQGRELKRQIGVARPLSSRSLARGDYSVRSMFSLLSTATERQLRASSRPQRSSRQAEFLPPASSLPSKDSKHPRIPTRS